MSLSSVHAFSSFIIAPIIMLYLYVAIVVAQTLIFVLVRRCRSKPPPAAVVAANAAAAAPLSLAKRICTPNVRRFVNLALFSLVVYDMTIFWIIYVAPETQEMYRGAIEDVNRGVCAGVHKPWNDCPLLLRLANRPYWLSVYDVVLDEHHKAFWELTGWCPRDSACWMYYFKVKDAAVGTATTFIGNIGGVLVLWVFTRVVYPWRALLFKFFGIRQRAAQSQPQQTKQTKQSHVRSASSLTAAEATAAKVKRIKVIRYIHPDTREVIRTVKMRGTSAPDSRESVS